MLPLAELDVLVVDCQATAAAPRGHLLELGWAHHAGATISPPHTRLIRLPDRERVPPAVARITGISESMTRDGVEAQVAWQELLAEASACTRQPAPTVIHFARFEEPFLRRMAGGAPPLDITCTHEIARRILPDLPRRSLRALAGYFGRAVGVLRRSAGHVEATSFVWRELVALLHAEGVCTWDALHEWLASSRASTRRGRRLWPLPRDVRLALPDGPGIYRMLRTSGDVLYVGKASSLRRRVNSYFRKQSGIPERMLEMLSQVRAISYDLAPSALEAALLEPDEIKRLRPPYNVALGDEDRTVWFAAPDLATRSPRRSPRCPLGPFPSAETLDRFTALTRANAAALGRGRWGPEADIFEAGYTQLCARHPELAAGHTTSHRSLLHLGTRLWREGRRDHDDGAGASGTDGGLTEWTADHVQVALEWLVLQAALARRRARWLTRLVDAAMVWSEPGMIGARLIVIENGEVIVRLEVNSDTPPPVPPGYRRPIALRRESFTIASFDRLRVLLTELKRLVAAGAPVALRLGGGAALTNTRLARVLAWV